MVNVKRSNVKDTSQCHFQGSFAMSKIQRFRQKNKDPYYCKVDNHIADQCQEISLWLLSNTSSKTALKLTRSIDLAL